MLPQSPSLFSTSYGWPLEDLITLDLDEHDCNEEISYNSLLDFHKYDPTKHDFVSGNPVVPSGVINASIGKDTFVAKKLNRNASERDRRKKFSELYSFLRSRLPMSYGQKKNVSSPGIVSRALKYIPELQQKVEKLRSKKEKLSTSTANARQDHDLEIKTKSSVVTSVSILGDTEAVIQLILSNDHMGKNKDISLLSKVLEYLEREEDDLVLKNATTFKCSVEGVLSSTLHLQVQGDHKIEAETLKKKLHIRFPQMTR